MNHAASDGGGKVNGHKDESMNGEAVEGIENVTPEDATIYLKNYKAHRTGIAHEEMVQVYTEWANDYDHDVCPGRYNGPEIAAQFMGEHYPLEGGRQGVLVLDVAAGTGRVGHELHKIGFRQIDALEPSSGMLKLLRERKIYGKTFESAIGYNQIKGIETDAYDALVIAGGMGEGHIPVQAADEMIRIVKPGGMVLIVMREEYLSYVKEYAETLEPYMNRLEKKGAWRQVGRNVVPEYSFNKNGVVFSYEVLDTKSKYMNV